MAEIQNYFFIVAPLGKKPKDPTTQIETTLDIPYEFVWQGSGLSHDFWDVGDVVQTSFYDEQGINSVKANFWENYGQIWQPDWG